MAGVQACQNFQKKRYAMKNDKEIITLRQPESVGPLTAQLATSESVDIKDPIGTTLTRRYYNEY